MNRYNAETYPASSSAPAVLPPGPESPPVTEDPAALSRATPTQRSDLIVAFQNRYQFFPPLDEQASDETLGILISLHKRRALDVVPLAKVTVIGDGVEPWSEPKRLKGTPFFYDTREFEKKKGEFWASPQHFVHSVRVLMVGYALVSAADPGVPWVDYHTAMSHVATVERNVRLDCRTGGVMFNRLTEIEVSVRREWFNASQMASVTLTEVIVLIAQRPLWPLKSDFPALNQGAAATVPIFTSNATAFNTVTTAMKGKRTGKRTPEENRAWGRELEATFRYLECVHIPLKKK